MSSLTAKTIHLASDHGGFVHKEAVRDWLMSEGVTVVDHGSFVLDVGDDYPDFICLAAAAVSQSPIEAAAIIFGGSGQGEAMLANRFQNVRATAYYGGNQNIVTLSRTHNDANVLSIGARFVELEETKAAITLWLQTEVSADQKYTRRNQKIEKITKHMRTV